uniref:Uncharacterized protein n=1 Tax=Timema shepardi TaxID=629360 RepID=A0A7R9AVE6_TIMSH|nr:unnamed protein product [Timema shepardi]
MNDTNATVNGDRPAKIHVSFRKAYDHDDLHEDPNFPLKVDTAPGPTRSYCKLTQPLLGAIESWHCPYWELLKVGIAPYWELLKAGISPIGSY